MLSSEVFIFHHFKIALINYYPNGKNQDICRFTVSAMASSLEKVKGFLTARPGDVSASSYTTKADSVQ